MDEIARVFFEQDFKLAFYLKKGDEFENWFAEIMELRYPGDFKRVRPWGRVGDRKNDGYLRSKRTMFQVYAPNELRNRDTLRKINEDYAGAVPHWEQYFDKWIFVHNSKDGLSPEVNQRLLDLNSQGPFVVDDWGFPELHYEVFELNQLSLQRLFRPPPAIADLYNITFTNLENVLQYVAKKPLPDDGEKKKQYLMANWMQTDYQMIQSSYFWMDTGSPSTFASSLTAGMTQLMVIRSLIRSNMNTSS